MGVGDHRVERQTRYARCPQSFDGCDIECGDRRHPILPATRARNSILAGFFEVLVVAGRETRDPVLKFLRLRGVQFGGALANSKRLYEDVAVKVRVARAATEVLGALATRLDHLLGDHAEMILGLRITLSETEACEAGRLDVRNPKAGAANASLVATRRGLAAPGAGGLCRLEKGGFSGRAIGLSGDADEDGDQGQDDGGGQRS